MRRRHRRHEVPVPSTGSWADAGDLVVVCHPDWRGVRTAAVASRADRVEVADAGPIATELAAKLAAYRMVVLHGYPPGSGQLLEELHRLGAQTRVVLHSSPAQHGGEAGEAAVADEVLELARQGIVGRVGFVKASVSEPLRALGYPVDWVPNRVPELPAVTPMDLGPGRHVGIFAESFWRKNVVTQLLAVTLMDETTAHVLHAPDVAYVRGVRLREHGVQPWEDFLSLQASVDLNLYVTLSECYPLTPMESYLAGVPCLMSRTSSVFLDDNVLWDLTTVDLADDPVAIAAAAQRLVANADEAVSRARSWMDRWDEIAIERWTEFTAP